ncbi:hypothetical protein NIES2107_05750 [Nostoc carneum NIES-2107]|nr:hypothetical protein NIES2107_05750 [Nostoc carneum NIES-2107]
MKFEDNTKSNKSWQYIQDIQESDLISEKISVSRNARKALALMRNAIANASYLTVHG